MNLTNIVLKMGFLDITLLEELNKMDLRKDLIEPSWIRLDVCYTNFQFGFLDITLLEELLNKMDLQKDLIGPSWIRLDVLISAQKVIF